MIEKTYLYATLKSKLSHQEIMQVFVNLKIVTGMTDLNIVNFANTDTGIGFGDSIKLQMDRGSDYNLATLQVCKQYKHVKKFNQWLTWDQQTKDENI